MFGLITLHYTLVSLGGAILDLKKEFGTEEFMPFDIDFVKVERNLGEDDYVTHIGIDGGGGSIKVTLNLVPSYDTKPPQLPPHLQKK